MKALLFSLDPERAHGLALGAARLGGGLLGRLCGGRLVEGLECELAGLRLPNPVGLAAGFDKNGVALPFWRAVGFGFVEFGTVTPRPQAGNERPRLWRFPEQAALGNRLGFPNHGAAAVAERILRDKRPGDVVGINLGKNRDTPLLKAADDYVAALEATRGVADYWVVNVSSPNTPRLRELQSKRYLAEILERTREAAGEVPLFLKLSPDLDDGQLVDVAEVFAGSGCAGIIATNTTLARPEGIEFEGGLSGRPLAKRSREILRKLRQLLGRETPIISAGGIDSGAEARQRFDEGASLVQIYSALIFQGPALPTRILRELAQ
ncbi:MAG: quinone-dependent dihydroorotate dehydrogenase [Terriglobia bacterium]